MAFGNLFTSPEELFGITQMLDTPAMVSMLGPIFGETATLGSIYSQSMLLFTAIAAGVMSIFLVVRNTRKDEDEGRTELIRSLPVGRLSNLMATLIVCIIVNVVLAIIIGAGLALSGIQSMNVAGSFLYGAAIGVTGILFAAITAIFSQVSATSRGAFRIFFHDTRSSLLNAWSW